MEKAPLKVNMPDGWVYTYLVLACAWSPGGGCTPGEWKHLMSSDGPSGRGRKRKNSQKPGETIEIDGDDPITSLKAISRLNPNDESMNRTQQQQGHQGGEGSGA